jgi:hypothetical protein
MSGTANSDGKSENNCARTKFGCKKITFELEAVYEDGVVGIVRYREISKEVPTVST